MYVRVMEEQTMYACMLIYVCLISATQSMNGVVYPKSNDEFIGLLKLLYKAKVVVVAGVNQRAGTCAVHLACVVIILYYIILTHHTHYPHTLQSSTRWT
jgi:hypothetical protein